MGPVMQSSSPVLKSWPFQEALQAGARSLTDLTAVSKVKEAMGSLGSQGRRDEQNASRTSSYGEARKSTGVTVP